MPDRKMFWRIIRRLFAAQRGRLLVILLALSAGASLTAALLNIQVDAKSGSPRNFVLSVRTSLSLRAKTTQLEMQRWMRISLERCANFQPHRIQRPFPISILLQTFFPPRLLRQ